MQAAYIMNSNHNFPLTRHATVGFMARLTYIG
jgi:hypothetical protein